MKFNSILQKTCGIKVLKSRRKGPSMYTITQSKEGKLFMVLDENTIILRAWLAAHCDVATPAKKKSDFKIFCMTEHCSVLSAATQDFEIRLRFCSQKIVEV